MKTICPLASETWKIMTWKMIRNKKSQGGPGLSPVVPSTDD